LCPHPRRPAALLVRRWRPRRRPLPALLGLAGVSGPLLTARAVADLLGVSAETVLRWTRRGELPAIRLPGGAIRFRPEELEGWLSERATPARGVVEHPAGRRPPASVALNLSSTPTSEED
jgi:excisionase family DNA binding protein